MNDETNRAAAVPNKKLYDGFQYVIRSYAELTVHLGENVSIPSGNDINNIASKGTFNKCNIQLACRLIRNGKKDRSFTLI